MSILELEDQKIAEEVHKSENIAPQTEVIDSWRGDVVCCIDAHHDRENIHMLNGIVIYGEYLGRDTSDTGSPKSFSKYQGQYGISKPNGGHLRRFSL